MQLQELGSILEEKTDAITKKIKMTVLFFLTIGLPTCGILIKYSAVVF